MKITNINHNNLNFQKTLMAKANIIKDNQKSPCKIYELDPYDDNDLDYFKPLYGTLDARKNTFFDDIESDFLAGIEARFYVMEDENGRCLGACEVNENLQDNADELVFLETAATVASANCNRNIKYVGETLLRYAIGMAKKGKRREFVVIDPTPYAYMFYIKQGFREHLYDENLYIKAKDYDEAIAINACHTGKMEYLA